MKLTKPHGPNRSRSSILEMPFSNLQARSLSNDRWSNRAAFISASLRSLSSFLALICSNF